MTLEDSLGTYSRRWIVFVSGFLMALLDLNYYIAGLVLHPDCLHYRPTSNQPLKSLSSCLSLDHSLDVGVGPLMIRPNANSLLAHQVQFIWWVLGFMLVSDQGGRQGHLGPTHPQQPPMILFPRSGDWIKVLLLDGRCICFYPIQGEWRLHFEKTNGPPFNVTDKTACSFPIRGRVWDIRQTRWPDASFIEVRGKRNDGRHWLQLGS